MRVNRNHSKIRTKDEEKRDYLQVSTSVCYLRLRDRVACHSGRCLSEKNNEICSYGTG